MGAKHNKQANGRSYLTPLGINYGETQICADSR